jgi:hypothetical protein
LAPDAHGVAQGKGSEGPPPGGSKDIEINGHNTAQRGWYAVIGPSLDHGGRDLRI